MQLASMKLEFVRWNEKNGQQGSYHYKPNDRRTACGQAVGKEPVAYTTAPLSQVCRVCLKILLRPYLG